MTNWVDYYEILGIDPAARPEEIRAAYRRKALELHPDRFPRASEAERLSAGEAFTEVNRTYEVLGNEEKRRNYHADWIRSNSPPKPVLEPSVIVFNNAVPGEGNGSFVIRNDGCAYDSIWFSDPDSWVKVTGYASFEPEDELPLRVEIAGSGHGWGTTIPRASPSGWAVSRLRSSPGPHQTRAEPSIHKAGSGDVPASRIPGLGKVAGLCCCGCRFRHDNPDGHSRPNWRACR